MGGLQAEAGKALTADFLPGDITFDLLGLSLVELAILDKISESFFLGEDRDFCSVLDGIGEEGDLMLGFVDRQVLDEPLVLRLTDDIMAADASQVSDDNVFVFLDEEVLPEELDERVTEKLCSQSVVVLFEDEKHRGVLHSLEGGPLDYAREEDDQHLRNAVLVEKTIGHLYTLEHVFGNLLRKVRDCPVLEPLHVVIDFKLLAENRSESSQDRFVECVDLDRLR